MGWIAYLQGDYKGALPLLEEAAKALPRLAVVRYHLGMTYLALNRPQEARTELLEADKLLAADDPLKPKVKDGVAKLPASGVN